ncbi:MAG: shikimate kinase [Chthoniobacterales bacterium]
MNRSAKSIVLIGMMGAGKTSAGQRLQQRTGLPLVDTDEIVTAELGMSVPEIFAKFGEEKFREAETAVLRGLSPDRQSIIVTGGGIVLREANVDLLKRLGIVVWLDAGEETMFERATRNRNRPLLETKNPREAFSRILEARRSLYSKIADVRIDTAWLTEEEVAKKILQKASGENK